MSSFRGENTIHQNHVHYSVLVEDVEVDLQNSFAEGPGSEKLCQNE